MIALRVKKNGKLLCVAGAEDLCVLSAHVTAIGVLGSKTLRSRRDETVDLRSRIGGLTGRKKRNDVHLLWRPDVAIALGDKVEIEVIETDSADVPDDSHPAKRNEPKAQRKRK